MNARALLQAQGWRGEGHTLHATNDSIGLKNRLLVGRKGKDNNSGLGASSAVNDQWWLSALDEQLGGLTTKNGKVVQTLKDGKLDRLNDTAGQSELYKFFVSGGTLQGTLDYLKKEAETGSDKASRGSGSNAPTTDSKLRTITMTVKQMHIETETTSSSSESSSKQRGTKEERRARKEERRQRRERKQVRREARKQKSSTTSTDADESTDISNAAKGETKEERRARKEARRKRKEGKRRTKR